MKILVCDIESYYAKDYSLSKKDCTTQSYIDDERFEVIGVSVMEDGIPPYWFSGNHRDTDYFLRSFDWENAALIAHNALFDASILAWRFGIYPKLVIDTLSMARAVHGSEVGNSLAKLATHYGLGEKGLEVHDAKGKRRRDFSPGELWAYGNYCKNDVMLTRKLFDRLAVHFTRKESKLIDMTIRMHTEPQFNLDRDLLKKHLSDVQEKKEQLLAEAGVSKDDLMSNPKLAAVLESWGVPVPMKTSLKTGKQAFAFAKTDTEFTALLEHPDLRVQTAVAARLGLRSTLEETRTERFIKIAEDHGSLPIPLKYGDTLTHRWAGCLVADSLVTVYDVHQGVTQKKIVEVLLDDLVWDGEDFVPHEGVQFSGYAEVITWDDITGTEDHVVYTENGALPLSEAMLGEHRIQNARGPTQDDVDRARVNLHEFAKENKMSVCLRL